MSMQSEFQPFAHVVKYDENWPKLFEAECEKLRDGVSELILIEHIGSTSVPGLDAKPVIDIQASIKEMPPSDQIIEKFKKLGYKHVPLPKMGGPPPNDKDKNDKNNKNDGNDDEKAKEQKEDKGKAGGFDLSLIYTQFEKKGYMLHLKQDGNADLWDGAIDMRDYMRVNKDVRDKYMKKKKEILESSKDENVSIMQYTLAKREMVTTILEEAKQWKLNQQK